MLELHFTLLEDELDHDTGNEGQGNSHHQGEVKCSRGRFLIFEKVIDRERCVDNVELKGRIVRRHPKDRIVHELREKRS